MLLPYSDRPWAKALAIVVIALSVAAAIGAFFMLRMRGPLDTAEFTAIALFLIAVIPPNIAIIRRRPGALRESITPAPLRLINSRSHIR